MAKWTTYLCRRYLTTEGIYDTADSMRGKPELSKIVPTPAIDAKNEGVPKALGSGL